MNCSGRLRTTALNSESILSKDQLFDMFQQCLFVKKFEHQIIFNALQVWQYFSTTNGKIIYLR